MATAFYQNDNLVEVVGLQNAATGAYINAGATVTATVNDLAGGAVTGATWPLALAYVAGSNGNWRATIPDEAQLAKDAEYVAVIVADAGPGLAARWEFRFVCKTRTE